MRKYTLLSLMLMALFSIGILTGCTGSAGNNETDLTGKIVLDDEDFVFLNESEESTVNDTDATSNEDLVTVDDEDIEDLDVAYTVEVVEEELVKLNLQAVDPDGDIISYEFTEPLNAQGRWQTQIGDEGKYLSTVTASDGKLSTSEDVLIVVNRANRAPTIECPDTFTVKEGETAEIDCNIYDEEGNSILVSYEGWTTTSMKKTDYEDAGEYTVLVRASDSQKESTQKVDVVVENVNRAPTVESIEDFTVMETTRVEVVPKTTDPDGDAVTVSFSSPLNEDGVWQTTDGDSGAYTVVVTVSDGTATASESFEITVTQINTAPVLKPIADITVSEGETVKIPVNAYDPEGDEITVTYSGFMSSDSYETSYDDEGSYEQTVTVTDGVLSTSETFTITVENKNRAPTFIIE